MYFLQPSQKRLLNSLNPLFVVGLVFALILVRTTMEPLMPFLILRCEILLPVIVYLGQRRTLPEGIILALFCSHLFSLCSAAPIGVFATHYLILFIVARLLSYVTYVSRWYSVILLLFSLAVLSHFLLMVISRAFGHSLPVFVGWAELPSRFVVTAFCGYLIYGCLGALDKMTFKVPRINIELAEGEL